MCAILWWDFRLGPKHKLEENWPVSLTETIMKMESFSNVGWGEKSLFKRDNKFSHKKTHHEPRVRHFKREKPKQFQGSNFKPKGNFIKKGAPFKANRPKEDASGKPKRACFNCNEVGHYSKNCPKPKSGNGGSKVIALTTNLAQGECNCLFFLREGF